jgi:outer membrane protein
MKRFLLTGMLCALAGQAGAETLSEIWSLAQDNDYQLKAAQAAADAGSEERNIARAGLLPRLQAQGALSHTETATDDKSSNPFAVNQSANINQNSPGYLVSLVQPVFDLAAWHDYKRGGLAADEAVLEYERQKTALMLHTCDLYLQALTAGAKLEAAESAEKSYRLRLNAAKIKFDVGMARQADVLDAQAALDAAAADTVVARNKLDVAFDLLKVITGLDHVELDALPQDFVAHAPIPADFSRWEQSAGQYNPDIAIAQLRMEEARQNASARKADLLPKLSGSIDYSNGYDHRTYSNAIPDQLYQQGWTAQLTLTVPIYSGGAPTAHARQAEARYREQRETGDAVRRDVLQAAHALYLSVTSGVAAVEARKAAIVSNRGSLEYAQRGYEEGVVNMLNVLDAEHARLAASQNYADSLYSYLMAMLRLKQVAGALSPRDIDELSNQLDRGHKVVRPAGKQPS